MADRIVLDPNRFRFAQRFTAGNPKSWKEAYNGVHLCKHGYVATDGTVLILIPSALTIEGETLIAPKLPRNVSALAWIPDGRWLEVETFHGAKGRFKRRSRYALDAPNGSFPKLNSIRKLLNKPMAPIASIVIDPTLLSKFGGMSLLSFRGSQDHITVSSGCSSEFPWVGVLMPCRGIYAEPTESIIKQFYPEGESDENNTPAS